MNIMQDALDKLFELNSEAIIDNNYLLDEEIKKNGLDLDEIREKLDSDEDYEFEDEFDDEDIDDNEEDFETMLENSNLENAISPYEAAVLNQILEGITSIKSQDYTKYENFISLLLIQYFITVYIEMREYEGYYPKEGNEIIDLMMEENKQTVLNNIINSDNGYFEEIIAVILNEYDSDERMRPKIDYLYMEDVLSEKCIQDVFKKFHPNLIEEAKEYKEYMKHLKISDNLVKVKVNSLPDFIFLSSVVKNNITKLLYYYDIIVAKLNAILIDNENLYIEIKDYLIKYLYVSLKNKKDRSDEENAALATLEEEPEDDVTYCQDMDFLIEHFYNYDITNDYERIENIDEATKVKIKKFIS